MSASHPVTQQDTTAPVVVAKASGQSEQQVRKMLLRAAGLDSPSAFAGGQLGRLLRLLEDFGHLVAPRAAKELGITLETGPSGSQEMLWREARPLPSDQAVTVVFQPSGGGTVLLSLDPALVALVVERLLGTEPDPARPLRPVTLTDRWLVSRFTDLLIGAAQQLWGDATGTELVVSTTSLHTEAEVPLASTDRVLVIPLETQVFGNYVVAHTLISESAVTPISAALARPSTQGTFEDPSELRAVQSRIAQANVDVQAQLGSIRLTAAEIARLRPGDVLPVGGSSKDAVELRIDGATVRYATPGVHGPHRAVRLLAGRAGADPAPSDDADVPLVSGLKVAQ